MATNLSHNPSDLSREPQRYRRASRIESSIPIHACQCQHIRRRAQNINYTYNTAGRISTVSYPVSLIDPNWYWGGCLGGQCYYPNYGVPYKLTYGFDGMGRPNSLTDNYVTSISQYYTDYWYPAGWPSSPTTTWVQNVQYDYAGRLASMQYLTNLSDNGNGGVTDTYTTESRSYNTNGQLASLNFSGGVTGGIQYDYSATQNNGQITQAVDTVSGETIAYQYDALKRLTSASSTPNTGSPVSAWNQAFQYDGFGNLTMKVLNGTQSAIPVNGATNQLSNALYDANGNMTSGAGATLAYDASNRPVSAQEVSGGIEYYGYAPDNKEVFRLLPNGNQEFTFYGAQGEKLGVYTAGWIPGGSVFVPLRTNIYFAGKMIWSDNIPAYQDRLGTNRANGARFMPYGDEITSTSNDREKFATYTRDSYTGLDYADQRYYASTYGRFNTPDPYMAAAHGANNPKVPGSWNRYAYVQGDPVNTYDPLGLYQLQVPASTLTVSCNAAFDPYSGLFACVGQSDTPSTTGGGENVSTSNPQNVWDNLSPTCQKGLQTAMPGSTTAEMLAALTSADAAQSTLQAATSGTSISWIMVAAIGIRESGFQNRTEVDGAGLGVGIFQISVPGSGLTKDQAGNLTTAANYAAQLLNSNMATLAAKFPNFTPAQLLQATAASYNFGTGNISGNPSTIDAGSAPAPKAPGNYGSNIVNLMNCFN